MTQKSDQISGVPTSIITGFLGVGKTSTILHLLKNKPSQERWAILVNEFGEIGIDGSIFEGQYSEENGVYIREVPGGCMCCTAGAPMQVALTQLLRKSKPDRLLIEPTGLGHPNEVLETLNNTNLNGVLVIQNVITLLDARHLADNRYAEHDTFQQQIAIADVIVANKQDLYSEGDKDSLKKYLEQHSLSNVPVLFTEQGVVNIELIDGNRQKINHHSQSYRIIKDNDIDDFNEPIPECGFIKAVNKGEGFVSTGWRFSSGTVFDRDKLFTLISGLNAERLKATFITNDGCFIYNLTHDALSEIPIDQITESRVEIIALEHNQRWESELFSAITLN